MSTEQEPDTENLRDRITRQGEDALGKFAQDLLENPFVSGTLSRALEARERATQAQEVAMGALNLPSAADIERLTRRLRSVSQRLEGIEDAVDRLDGRLERIGSETERASGDSALRGVEAQLARLTGEVARLASDGASERVPAPVSREQERLQMDAPSPVAPGKAPKPAGAVGKAKQARVGTAKSPAKAAVAKPAARKPPAKP